MDNKTQNYSCKYYSTKDLIIDLRVELQKKAELLAKILPLRVKGYKDYWLSILWGFSKKYVYTLKRELKSNPTKKISNVTLNKLKSQLKGKHGAKSQTCIDIIIFYEDNRINPLIFIKELKEELGRISREIPVTLEELGLILVGSSRYITGIWERMNIPSHNKYYPDYKFSIERLEQFKEYLEIILGGKAKKCFQLIEKYKNSNPNLKEYKNQQYTIKKPFYFKNLDKSEELYWFGFLCADGWLVRSAIRDYYRIGIELSIKDRDRLERFAKVTGFPLKRIKERIRYTKDKSGNITANEMAYILFGCKPMFKDLIKYGLTYSKLQELPIIVKNLIAQAKIEASQKELNRIDLNICSFSKLWYYTNSGKLALAWLLGLYDGDGYYMGGNSASLTSSNVLFLKQIKLNFEVKNPVRIYEKSNSISLGSDLFKAMMWNYKNSMKRKRSLSNTMN